MMKRWTREQCEIHKYSCNGRRKTGRPRKRWIDEIEEDLTVMGIRNVRKMARD
jgi:hypothetical protein